MSYKNLPNRLAKLDLSKVAEATGLSLTDLNEIAGRDTDKEPRAATAGEAVALGKFLDIDPVKILHQQIAEELTEAGYTPPPKKEAPVTATRSPATPTPARRTPVGSSNW